MIGLSAATGSVSIASCATVIVAPVGKTSASLRSVFPIGYSIAKKPLKALRKKAIKLL